VFANEKMFKNGHCRERNTTFKTLDATRVGFRCMAQSETRVTCAHGNKFRWEILLRLIIAERVRASQFDRRSSATTPRKESHAAKGG